MLLFNNIFFSWFPAIIDNIAGKTLSKSDQDLPTVALAQFSSFDYVKPAAQELALEEIKALSATTNISGQDRYEKKQQPLANVNELAKQPNAIQSASFIMQYLLLMKRILVCAKRNYVSRNFFVYGL